MPDASVRLIYPQELFDVPVINHLIRRFDLTINITAAEISAEQGWLEIRITGDANEIEQALDWLKSQGIQIKNSAG